MDTVVEAIAEYEQVREDYIHQLATSEYPSYSALEVGYIAVGRAVLEALGYPTKVSLEEVEVESTKIIESRWATMRLAPPKLRQLIFERDNFTCRSCGSSAGPFHCDHVIPFVEGGLTTRDNLQTLCVSCNLKKGSRL